MSSNIYVPPSLRKLVAEKSAQPQNSQNSQTSYNPRYNGNNRFTPRYNNRTTTPFEKKPELKSPDIGLKQVEENKSNYFREELNSVQLTPAGFKIIKNEVAKFNKINSEIVELKKIFKEVSTNDAIYKNLVLALEKKMSFKFEISKYNSNIEIAKKIHFSGHRKEFLNLAMMISKYTELFNNLNEKNDKTKDILNTLECGQNLIERYTECRSLPPYNLINLDRLTEKKISYKSDFVWLYCEEAVKKTTKKFRDLQMKIQSLVNEKLAKQHDFILNIASILIQVDADTDKYDVNYEDTNEDTNEKNEKEIEYEYDDYEDKYQEQF